ncbi:uncharacterized protein A4U43_C05F40 [Asparagus officinalis]|uniref:Phytocyanin domain-containing protein n=1 Tax=Asparagus officinalis TaxID=4686 RepID=A0A5P1EN55_ASPOF|nr:lamin-like protein [Asparagus officinalis]ONK67438.1 uncharacterized protein A4U43_C05F40 [Asparagus officinalis]
MEHKNSINIPFFLLLFSSLLLAFFFDSRSVEGYKNYTVGGSLGWFDSVKAPKIDYKKWAAAKDFALGDFLIFNTDKNHSVVQTYNETTYEHCDYNDA